jgi:flagellar protein FliS
MMQAMVNKKALQGYGRNAIEAEIHTASPYRIIQMLMDGALSKIATAKGCIERGESSEKVRQITWAMNIINGLRTSLDQSQGGEIAENLDSLYDYMLRRLQESSINSDIDGLEEVSRLLSEVKAGWDGIPPEFH